jgi:hypothetical protein
VHILRIFKTKVFARFQRQEDLPDDALCEAVARAGKGLIDASLGHGLIKQRVARKGAGRRGGYRTVIAYRAGTRAVFIFGFAKNARENISAADGRELAETGGLLLRLDECGIETMIHGGELWEVECDGEEA